MIASLTKEDQEKAINNTDCNKCYCATIIERATGLKCVKGGYTLYTMSDKSVYEANFKQASDLINNWGEHKLAVGLPLIFKLWKFSPS